MAAGVEMRNAGGDVEDVWRGSEAHLAEEIVDDAVRGDETPINQGDGLDRELADDTRAAARHAPVARLVG